MASENTQTESDMDKLIHEILIEVYGYYFNDITRKPSQKHPTPDCPDVFSERTKQLPVKQKRQMLKNILTVLSVDLPEEINIKIDTLLQKELQNTQLVDIKTIETKYDKVALWRGDITTLKIDAIVNAANKYLLGCFAPNHPCIDNAIHCKAGPRLRAACREIVHSHGENWTEETGTAKITAAYNLPCKHVIHTVGPIIEAHDVLQPRLLESCYTECLELLKKNKLRSIAFCCISTGVFGYPQYPAAQVALQTVKKWLSDPDNYNSIDLILFDVFTESDHAIYQKVIPEFFDEVKKDTPTPAQQDSNNNDDDEGGSNQN